MLDSTVTRISTRGQRRLQAVKATQAPFRDALRRLANGVCVITWGAEDGAHGLTAMSVAPLSSEPPIVMVCLNGAAASKAGFAGLGAFAVNVLSADQRELADRFEGDEAIQALSSVCDDCWMTAPSGVPYLAGSAAALECELEERIERHAHAIFVARARQALPADGAGALLRWRGVYDQLGWSADEISRAVGLFPGRTAK